MLTGAAAELGGCVLAGTFLCTMAGPALEGLLAVGEAVPFVGEVCKALLMLKRHVDDFADEGEECWRLSVWCVGMMGSFSRLAAEATVRDAMKAPLQVAATAVKELYDLVKTRHENSQGVAGRFFAFWTSDAYLNKAKDVKQQVHDALNALMLGSSPQP